MTAITPHNESRTDRRLFTAGIITAAASIALALAYGAYCVYPATVHL
jgi:hypothetical protein